MEQIEKIRKALLNCLAEEPNTKEIREALEALNQIEQLELNRLQDGSSLIYDNKEYKSAEK